MTISTAITWLKRIGNDYKKDDSKRNHYANKVFDREKYEAICEAIKALEYDVPKVPLWEEIFEGTYAHTCPTCADVVDPSEYRCPSCDQLINWEPDTD